MNNEESTKELFVTVSNTNLTDGNGYRLPIYISSSYTTAYRLGKGKSVQGSDCYIETVIAKKVDGEWMIPMSSVVIRKPSDSDKFNDEKINILKKAKEMGLSEKEIEILSR